MHDITDLPAWERLFKKIVWKQLGDMEGKKILDFGSGEGITANHFAEKNDVTAIEPSKEMLSNAWKDCHNVLEYIDDKTAVVKALARVLKKDGIISIVKHNRAGRVMQMAVLLDDFEKANEILDGKDSTASKFGTIRYYEDNDITNWEPQITISDILGIRTFWDLQQNQQKHGDEARQEKMLQLELRVSQMREYKNIAFFHHLLLKNETALNEI